MKQKRFLFFILLIFSNSSIIANSGAFILDTQTRNYDQQHIRLNLRFDFDQKSVIGTADVQVIPLENNFKELILHSETTKVSSVKIRNKKLKFSHENGLLRIKLNRQFNKNELIEVTIKYISKPDRGLYFFSPSEEAPEIPYQIWTQGQGEDNRYWFPCFDKLGDRFTTEIIATVPDSFKVISNGRLFNVSENPKKNEKTFHWKLDYEQISYLNSLIIGEFTTYSDTVRGVQLNYNIPKNQKDVDVDLVFGRTPEMLTFLSDYVCPYPFEKYDQTPIQDFKHGGMENVTATTLNSRVLHTRNAVPNYSAEMLISHELVHQWFGNLITNKDATHLWLHEGFAVYFTDMYFEYQYGVDEFNFMRLDENRLYFKYRKSNPMEEIKPDKDAFTPSDLTGRIAYYRGAAVLHSLRYELGDQLFQKGIQYYTNKFRFKDILIEDFRQAMQEATGRDLTHFFKQWVYGAGHPIFEISWQWDDKLKQVTLNIEQIQKQTAAMGLFKMEISVEITAGKQKLSLTVPITDRKHRFIYELDQKPDMIRFDKGSWILKELRFKKSFKELCYQLKYDNEFMGRFLAAEQLADHGIKAVPVLKRSLIRDLFHEVRRTAVISLAKIGGPSALEALKFAANDPDGRVREAVMTAFGSFAANDVQDLLKEHLKNDTNDYVKAATAISLGRINAANAFHLLHNALALDSHKNIIRAGVFEGFTFLKDPRALPLAKEYSKYKYSNAGMHLSEIAALSFAMSMSDNYRDEIIEIAISALNNPFYKIKAQAAGILANLKAKEALPALKQVLKQDRRIRVQNPVKASIKILAE